MLLLHTDFMEWEPRKKALKSAEETKKGKVRVPEALVSLTSVEEGDGKDPKGVASRAVEEIMCVFREVKAKNLVIYPYVHLSQDPAKPDTALKILKEMERLAKGRKIPVKRAPFGWYKAFDLKCKGHPLSELSRDITSEGAKNEKDISDAVKKEAQLKSKWLIMEPSGKTKEIMLKGGKLSGFDFSKHPKLEKLCLYEMAKSRAVKEEPPHVALMKRLGMFSYEPGSDPGNFRFLPKGRMVKALMEEWVTQNVLKYGALEVETPIMYDYEHPCLKSYLNRFPARQYTIETPNKRVFLRFSACFGQFLMARDASISYRNLPLKMYEMTRYSFRVEQRGELAGLRRLRAFTMPDCHAICRDMPQAREEMLKRFDLANIIQNGLGISPKRDIEFSVRVVKDFLDENKAYVKKLAKKWGRPIMMEVWDKRFFYFVLKLEWNFIDALDKAACLATDQIDVENAERYGLVYTDKDNKKKRPVILHLSPSGSIERAMYALFEKLYMMQQAGKTPVLPLWLAPTQVRLCPVNEGFVKDCEKLADQLEKEGVRVDVDDRPEAVGRKIRDSEVEWVPFMIVFGEKEKKSKKLAVRFRKTKRVKQMGIQEIIRLVKKETGGKPCRPLPMPRLLTKRAVFV